MGTSNSHEYEPTSPPREECIRTLTVDPRSPTQDIERTPIVVEKTPEGVLGEPLDPRSPTQDIARTPIVVDKTREGVLGEPLDPRSPTVGIVRTPLSHFPQAQKGTDLPVFPKNDLGEETPSSPEEETDDCVDVDPLLHPLNLQDINDLSLSDIPISESTRLMPLDIETGSTDEPEKPKKKKKPRSTQPKELFPSKKVSGLKDATRSPLSSRNVDMNSPLHIVQRKQMKDVDIKRTCAQENTMSRFIVKDKENI